MKTDDLLFLRAVAALATCNPFVPERMDLERLALGTDFEPHGDTWHPSWRGDVSVNVVRIQERLAAGLPDWRDQLVSSSTPDTADLTLYRDAVYYALYNHYLDELRELIEKSDPTDRVSAWKTFQADFSSFLPTEIEVPDSVSPELLFAWFFQLRRAFHFIFTTIFGSSPAAAELRAQIWQSVFSHDMQRYRHGLYERMRDYTTLITGASGTGKELVAQAIALSQFIPFDPHRQAFQHDFRGSLYALNLSALSPTLIESELFGHRKGSFTGALEDRQGWLESCPAHGTVFLDEIGEVSEEIQVKLLRVLQTRTFQRIGDTRERRFEGKLTTATNREPQEEMAQGRMRTDFYYRICSDQIRTPSLREHIAHSDDELALLLRVVVNGLVGPSDVEPLAIEVAEWIASHLGPDYPWPGNFRELEQCARNILLRGTYHPAGRDVAADDMATQINELSLDADTLLQRYVTLAYHRIGSYVGAAEKLGLDRRTVKAKIDPQHLATLRGEPAR